MPGLQRETRRKKYLGSCPLSLRVSLSGHHSGLLAPGSPLSQVGDGRQWAPPAHGKGDFPEFQGITELVLEPGKMLLEGMLGVLSAKNVISRPLAPSPPLRAQPGSSLGSLWLGKP